MGFMSTSRSMEAPISYMQAGAKNVLWQLECRKQSITGFHSGADISMLSQFGGEE